MRYVLLLRGVNVGGKHNVPRQEFYDILAQLGCRDISIYINSGNAVFSHNNPLSVEVLQSALEGHFSFPIPFILVNGANFIKIANQIPEDWTNDTPKPDKSGQKSDVLFLFDKIDSPDILQKFGYDPKVEDMHYVPGAIISRILRINQSRGCMNKIIGTRLYANITIRNINTVRKLATIV